MYVVISVTGDPTSWYAEGSASTADTIAGQLSQGEPVSVDVIAPLRGKLIVSARAAVAVLVQIPHESWIPSGLTPPATLLYVPSPAGPTKDFPGYPLPAATDVAALEQQITSAMRNGTAFATPVSTDQGDGNLVLSGAALSLAVLYLPQPG